MRKFANRIACALTSVALLPLGAPTAHADDASFVRDAKALGFAFDTDNLISMGRSACYFLSRNRDPGQVAERIMRYGNVDLNAANEFLAMSVTEYCPQFGDRVNT
jgi:ABC-type hemin transport system ATPase subunit